MVVLAFHQALNTCMQVGLVECINDLEASDIIGSKVVLNNRSDTTLQSQDYVFVTHQLAPDGRIYISGSSQSQWSVINEPNEKGFASAFEN